MRVRRLLLACLLTGAPTVLPAAPASGMSMEQRLERLERRAARVTDLTLAVDALRRDNRRLQGEIEELRHELQQVRRKQRDIYLDLDQRLSALYSGTGDGASVAAQGAATPPPTGGAKVETPAPQPGKVGDPAKMQAEYQAAYTLLSPQQRRYGEAAKAFAEFLEKYPASSLAANARYWLGEAYYVSQKNAKAMAAFEQLVQEHPDSVKVPGALYKIGRIQAAEGKLAEARKTFQRLISDYPSSPAAGLAREQLKRLRASR